MNNVGIERSFANQAAVDASDPILLAGYEVLYVACSKPTGAALDAGTTLRLEVRVTSTAPWLTLMAALSATFDPFTDALDTAQFLPFQCRVRGTLAAADNGAVLQIAGVYNP